MLAAALARGLPAQVCAGFPSLRQARFRVAGAAAAYRYARVVGASFTTGRDTYATLAVGRTRDDELDANTYDFRLTVGADVSVAGARRLNVCPGIEVSESLGPYDFLLQEGDWRSREAALRLGLAASALRLGPLMVIPHGSVRLTRLTVTRYPSPGERQSFVMTLRNTDLYWLLSGGVGLALHDAVTVRPGFTIPLGLMPPEAGGSYAVPFGRAEGEVSFDVSVGIGFGRRSTRPPSH
jgi:hypothetical protein